MKKILRIICLLLLLAIPEIPYAQFTPQWANRFGSTAGDIGYNATTDLNGNVFLTGYFNNAVDFDPGPGTFNLTGTGSNDIFIAKYDANGNFLWAHAFGTASGSDIAEIVSTDAAGNVYLGAVFANTIDFDPGPGTANLTAAGFSSGVLAKYDPNGVFVWAFNIATGGTSGIGDIRIDASNNVFITGSFSGTADFDPGAGTANLTAVGNTDAFFAKYDANGNYQFAKSFGSTANDNGVSITLDGSNNIFISGQFRLTCDFDPGAGVSNITAVGTLNDVFFAKYDPSGNFTWAKSIGSTTNEASAGIVVDASGNLFIAGFFGATADFDPGAGVVNLSPVGGFDLFMARYNSNGDLIWAKQVGSTLQDGQASSIAEDGTGGFYIATDFSGTVDADPGSGVQNFTSLGSSDILLAHYDANGNYSGASSFGGSSTDNPFDISLAGSNQVLVCGFFQGSADFDPGSGNLVLNSAGIFDIFLGKYSISGALPTKFYSFTATCRKKDVLLEWVSAEEKNTKEFILEKSDNSYLFRKIAVLPAAGNSTSKRTYQYIDGEIGGLRYYRVRSKDGDGSEIISKMVALNCEPVSQRIAIHPNPANSITFIQVPPGYSSNNKITVSIIDLSGKKTKLVQYNLVNSRIGIDISQLARGSYILQIELAGNSFFEKLVKY